MDSVENIKRNKKKLFVYSLILLIFGVALGYLAYHLYNIDKYNNSKDISIKNREIENDKAIVLAEELLINYTNYYEKNLINDNEELNVDNHRFYLVSNNFKEIDEMFTSNIKLDDIYTYYDIDNKTNIDLDGSKPLYTKKDDNYYFDGVCNSTGNKLSYSEFNVINRSKDRIELSYKITIMSIVDNEIMESYDEERMILKYENGSWKINKAYIIGRCGLPYKID